MGEHRPIDDSLCRIVIDIHALEHVEEGVRFEFRFRAVRSPRFLECPLHAVLAQGMSERPFRDSPVRAALDTRLQSSRPGE